MVVLLDQLPTTRVLAVLTFRPDFRPPWPPRSHIAQLMLARLGRQEVETIVALMAGNKRLPPELTQEVVSKTDGVPLFVEELTRMVMESGLLRERDGHYELRGPLHALALSVPDAPLKNPKVDDEGQRIADLSSQLLRA